MSASVENVRDGWSLWAPRKRCAFCGHSSFLNEVRISGCFFLLLLLSSAEPVWMSGLR